MLFWLVRVAKDFIELLSDSDKSGPLWHLFDTSGTNVGTSRPETSQNIQHCGIYITPVKENIFYDIDGLFFVPFCVNSIGYYNEN